MYLWNTKALARELREGTLSEREKFKYLLANVVLYALLLELASYSPLEYSESNLLMSLFSIIATIVGTYICYRTNQNGDGVKFIERYICLGVPLSIKILVLLIVAALLFAILMGVQEDTTILDSAVVIVITIIYYWRLNVHIKSISHNNASVVSA